MRNLRLIVAYDGTEFHGWQRQPGKRTVQGVMETELSEVFQMPIRLSGAGRTDAGCHARGQVASMSVESRLPVAALLPVMNRRLPPDIRVRSATHAPPGFDARRTATGRRYAYRLLREEDVLLRRIAWRPRAPIDAEALARSTAALVGEHDFATFHAAGSTPTTSVCRIVRASWRLWEGGVMLDIIADRFLYRMVRNIVGTALAIQRDADVAGSMRERLAARRRSGCGPTAPAHGLCLEEVFYPREGER